jgi:hypothetical protein
LFHPALMLYNGRESAEKEKKEGKKEKRTKK